MNVSVYIEQFQGHCDACAVKPERIVTLFLANISHELFSTLKVLVAPGPLQDQLPICCCSPRFNHCSDDRCSLRS